MSFRPVIAYNKTCNLKTSRVSTLSNHIARNRLFVPTWRTTKMSVKASLDRKIDHIDLCHTGSVGLHGDPGLFGDVRLLHNAMPELAVSDLDLSVPFLDHHLSTPIMVTGMTEDPQERARSIERLQASVSRKVFPLDLGASASC